MTSLLRASLIALFASLAACAARHTPDQLAMLQRKDCGELLCAADDARANHERRLAQELAAACPQAGLEALISAAPSPARALLWCGRARAALDRGESPSCSPDRVVALVADLHPLLTLGPADPEAPPDPLLREALAQVGAELHLAYDHQAPLVFVGQIKVSLDKQESETLAPAPDAAGKRHQVPATLHRVIARAEAQVELSAKTRTLHATEEARDTTWQEEARLAVAARFEPQIPPEDELRKRAVRSLLRNIARALAAAPPEGIEPTDETGCMAYGLALAVATGDRSAAANGVGDPDKLAACEKLLEMPVGAGIPVP